MPFIQYEISDHQAFPVELYEVYSDAFSTYYLTSSDEDIVYNGNTYIATEDMRRSQPELSDELEAQNISVILPRDHELAKRWLSFIPPRTVWIKILKYHRSEVSTPEVVTFWQGKIRGVSWSVNEAELSCYPIDVALTRNGLRRTNGSTCQHMLYDPRTCKVPLASFSKTAVISQITGNKIYSPQFVTTTNGTTTAPDGWWTAGFVENPTTQELRMIVGHSGTEIELLVAFETLQVGDSITVAAGCNRSAEACRNKFNNIVNNGALGMFSPAENPFLIKLT